MSIPSLALPKGLLGEIRTLIESARQRATAKVNSELTLLFWRIGRRIYTEVLAGERAGYGEQIVPALATQLTRDYGHGFAEKSLRRMVQFAATFPDEPIVATLSRQLSWSHKDTGVSISGLLALRPQRREYDCSAGTSSCDQVDRNRRLHHTPDETPGAGIRSIKSLFATPRDVKLHGLIVNQEFQLVPKTLRR
jgi:hypothetical protein